MRFLDEKAQKTVFMLKSLIDKKTVLLEGFKVKFCDYKTDNVIPDIDDSWEELSLLMEFKELGKHFWIRGTLTTPKAENGIVYNLEFKEDYTGNLQTILYLNGKMCQGLDSNHYRTILEPDTTYDVAFYCYMDNVYSPRKHLVSSSVPKLVYVCRRTMDLYFDFATPFEASEAIDKTSDEYGIIIHHLELAANLIDFRTPYSKEYYDSVEKAISYLKEEFYGKACGKGDICVSCLGHSHIDVAWRWPVRQTVEKVQRSYSTVLYLMEHYPEYIFMMTTPKMYEFIKEQAPEKYEEIKQRVKEGRWEVDGAMWLEVDGNLPSGESFVRQLIYGKRFFMEEFGVNSRTLWIPDVFGYSAALPQILKKAGVDRFVTGKISWNDTDRMPHDSFYWKGIDQTEIFTQFLTNQDFVNPDKSRIFVMINGALDAREIKSTWEIYRDKEYNTESLHTFGFGDGGGGPTFEMLERQRRFAKGIPGIPKTKMSTLDEYLTKTQQNFDSACEKYGRTPKWSGELYLEYHRGTYTSMAITKRNNRKCEFALGKAEALSVFNMLTNNAPYPDFSKSWKYMLLNQFHDIIPGSSCEEVYEVSQKEYDYVDKFCNDVTENAISELSGSLSGKYAVFNPHSYNCSDVVKINNTFAYVEDVPSLGYGTYNDLSFENNAVIKGNTISNKYFEITLNERGNISKILDKTNNRLVISDEANVLRAYEDRPKFYDAWELTHYYKQKPYDIDEVVEIAPYRNGAVAGLTVKKKFMSSYLEQNIIVYDSIPRIDFETTINWNEDHLVLKALFPINVASNSVTAEIQFGNVERPNHTNTSWDEAKFEMCMHKWVDISDNGYGVSLINDCKYGFSADENVLGLTILKCAQDPNPNADKGTHKLTYSLYPHKNKGVLGGCVQMAYNLNTPMDAICLKGEESESCARHSFVSCDKENVIIETVKKCEDSGNVIIRMYDAYNMTEDVTLKLGFDVKRAYICDLLENKEQELICTNNEVKLTVKNFEIITLMLEVSEEKNENK